MKYILILFTCFLLFISCSKQSDSPSSSDEPGFITYNIENQNTQINFSPGSINIIFPDSVLSADNLIANFTLTQNCNAFINSVNQISGVSKNDFNTPLTYTIISNNSVEKNWVVTSSNNNFSVNYGLGYFIQKSADNNKTYSWYLDQLNTGFDSIDNCGPTAVTMAIKWADSTFSKTPQDARKAYEPNGGWWFTNDIDNYLTDNNTTHGIISLAATAQETEQLLKRRIDSGQIVILCVDMNYVTNCSNDFFHVDKFYYTTPADGHFLVVKGYTEVDKNFYFKVYDPNSWGQTYYDGSLKGKDRYYNYEDIFNASYNWWNYAIAIAKKGQALHNKLIYEKNNLKNIPVKYGK